MISCGFVGWVNLQPPYYLLLQQRKGLDVASTGHLVRIGSACRLEVLSLSLPVPTRLVAHRLLNIRYCVRYRTLPHLTLLGCTNQPVILVYFTGRTLWHTAIHQRSQLSLIATYSCSKFSSASRALQSTINPKAQSWQSPHLSLQRARVILRRQHP